MMLDHPIIDVAIGLIFLYVILSLVCSSIQEILASFLALRSKNLEKGIKNLIGDEYTKAMYNHPLIKGLRKPDKLPSYIKPEIFTTALLEVVAKDKVGKSAVELTAEELREAIGKIDTNNPARDLLLSLVGKGEHAVDVFRKQLAEWYDEGMDRVSGWYKRQVKYCLLGISVVVTAAVNADSIHIAKQLWKSDALRAVIVAEAERAAKNAETNQGEIQIDLLKQLETFPIGYSAGFQGFSIEMFVGWVLSIAAISLGAPFWFDLLSKISHLRGSGIREANRTKGQKTS